AKSSATLPNQVVMMQPQAAYPQTVYAGAPVTASVAAPVAAAVPEEGHIIKSPMVGTFYRSSAPGTPPFVEIGKEVKEGETICIIEAMKLLNEIDAAKAGVIRQILVENGQPVEFGQPLFVID
ncbi:MAG TPA: acetyl-CoA carboxylase biotin carboxyl carrier protein, partial [Herbaspirillum sp.]|nr:acetyl-CoA carboxylase biotin carboxyl carrier protein [Herbaspirillum sp.]